MKDMNLVTCCNDCPFCEDAADDKIYSYCGHPSRSDKPPMYLFTERPHIPDKCPLRIGPTAVVVKLA